MAARLVPPLNQEGMEAAGGRELARVEDPEWVLKPGRVAISDGAVHEREGVEQHLWSLPT